MSTNKISQAGILSCRHITKKFGEQEIFKDISFVVGKGEKNGLVGPNGAGKSTLLKMIAGIEECDSGTITLAKNTTVEYLPQVHVDEHSMSGGEIAKKVLAPIVSSDAGLFLLDEPTNNLDIAGLAMIERFISKSPKSFLIVSHDRKFLDSTVDKIIELNPTSGTAIIYDGGYSAYIEQKEANTQTQWKEYTDKVEKIESMNSSVDQRIGWMDKIEATRKNNKNLPMHEKEKPVAAVLRDKEGVAGKRAKILKARLERYKEDASEIERPPEPQLFRIEFDHERGSTKVFDLKNVSTTMGKKILGPINLGITYGDRIHIAGSNGSGKTTLLKLIQGIIKPETGSVEHGEKVSIGYVSQERWENTSDTSVIDEFMSATQMSETDSRKILNRFRISTEDVKKPVSAISPGEYSRLVIAELVAMHPNCIILDEPSNHLDLEVLEELEKGLRAYKGTLIVVSHDRYFVERVGLNFVFDVEKGNK